MFLAIGILFFLAWLATFYLSYVGHIFTYIFLFLWIIFIIIHFVLLYRRRGRRGSEL
jgi:hypothetical protein